MKVKNNYLTFILLSLIFVFLTSCAKFLAAPKPEMPVQNILPVIEPSVINLPITVNLDEIFQDIEKAVPNDNGEGSWEEFPKPCSGKGILFIWRRDPLKISMNGNTLDISTIMNYKLKYGRKIGSRWITLGTCGFHGDSMRRMEVKLRTNFKLSGNWQIIPETNVYSSPIDECKITIFEIDITKKLRDAIEPKLQIAVNRADEKLENLANFKTRAEMAWKALNEPILFDKQHDAWLKFKPLSISVSPINGSGNKAFIIFHLHSKPKVILSAHKPSEKNQLDLPDLVVDSDTEKGFHLELRGKLKHDEATKILSTLLVGKKFGFAGGKEIRVKSVKVFGSGVKTVIQVDVRGSFDGRIYFTGSPDYDVGKGELFIKDLDFDLKTKNLLTNTANWLLHGKFRDKIRQSARWDVSNYIVGAKTQLYKIINRKLANNISISGKVSDIRPIAVASIRHSFQIIVQLDGEARIYISEIKQTTLN